MHIHARAHTHARTHIQHIYTHSHTDTRTRTSADTKVGRQAGTHVGMQAVFARTHRGRWSCPFKLLPKSVYRLGQKRRAVDIYFEHSVGGLDMPLTLLRFAVTCAVPDRGKLPYAHQGVHGPKETAENVWDSRQDIWRTMAGVRVWLLIGLNLWRHHRTLW